MQGAKLYIPPSNCTLYIISQSQTIVIVSAHLVTNVKFHMPSCDHMWGKIRVHRSGATDGAQVSVSNRVKLQFYTKHASKGCLHGSAFSSAMNRLWIGASRSFDSLIVCLATEARMDWKFSVVAGMVLFTISNTPPRLACRPIKAGATSVLFLFLHYHFAFRSLLRRPSLVLSTISQSFRPAGMAQQQPKGSMSKFLHGHAQYLKDTARWGAWVRWASSVSIITSIIHFFHFVHFFSK